MLNVLQIIPTLDRSGAEKQMVLLTKGLPRHRFQVEVAALTRLGPLAEDLKAANIPVHLISKRFKADPLALLRLYRLMRAKRFDVVQTWIFAANIYGRMAAHWAKVPVIVTAEMAVDLWKGRNQFFFDRRLARWTDRVIGNSHAVVEFYRRTVKLPENKLGMIYSGIADEEPPQCDPAAIRAQFGLPPNAFLLIFAGRLYPQKGVDDLLHALDILQHVRPNLRTLIVGDGPLRDRLQRYARSTGLYDSKRVVFTGHRDDVPKLMAAANVLVLPSLYEGLPNVALEAMRFSKPVVATTAPGTTEVVVDEQTGLLVPVRDPTTLSKAILRLVDNETLAQRLGKAGRARVERAFRADQMVDRFAALYEDLARAKGLSV